MNETEDRTEVSGSAGPAGIAGSLKSKHTAELITMLLLVITTVLGYAYWQHDKTTESTMKEIAAAMRELGKGQTDATLSLTRAQQEGIAAQRELTCIISLPQERREAEFTSQFGFCKRITQFK